MSTASTTATVARRPKWHPIQPPPPSPKILNLPRRNRHRKQLKKPTKKPPSFISNDHFSVLNQNYYYYETKKGKLERLFGEEREFSRGDCSNVPIVLLDSSTSSSFSSSGRRDRVKEEEFAEEKWKFQAEILRAECNFWRMEREVALKKLETNKVQMERTLKSAVETVISGRKKIFEGENVNAVLAEEIQDLAGKLVELQGSSGVKDKLEVRNCSNFDKQACLLQRRLEKIGGLANENYVKELIDLAESNLSMNMNHDIDKGSCISGPRSKRETIDMELLRRKMEGLSKEMLQKIEEDFGSILSTTANSSVASSASTSKRIVFPPDSAFSSRQPCQELTSQEDNRCTGRCKAIVRRIVEQVKAETEQWSQMKGMLLQVREEMEELQDARKFWEDRAINSDHEVQCLQSAAKEWKEKAMTLETKANELEAELSLLKGNLEKQTAQSTEQNQVTMYDEVLPPMPVGKQFENVSCGNGITRKQETAREKEKKKEERDSQSMQNADSLPVSLAKQLENEKRMLRLEKEKRMLQRLRQKHRTNGRGSNQEHSSEERRKSHNSGIANLKRSPFRDIGNLSPVKKADR